MPEQLESGPAGERNSIGQSGGNFMRILASLRRWWRMDVIQTVEQGDVIARRKEDSGLTERYLFMTAMAGGIAILGLLLSSPAVVIGAMLLSPLMGPIMGLGFALAIGDYHWLKQSARTLAWGSLIAILLCAVLVFLSPIQTVTPEIAARTRPNLFDLLIALFSALAGAYATIRGREGTIVGVAIATALMPPLAVVGFGLATLNWTVFSGALLLFVTNLVTIALTSWAMARLYGFRTSLSERNTLLQNGAIAGVMLALAVPLAISLQQIAWETNAQRQIRGDILDSFDAPSRLSQLDINFEADPIEVEATVLTPRIVPDAEQKGERVLTRQLGRPIALTINQYQVGTSATAAQQAELSASRAQEEAASRRASELAAELALVAGVAETDVTVDRERRRAVVRAQPLEGASLVTYRALEQRILDTRPGWQIELTPPLGPLPSITFANGQPDAAGQIALDLAAWAARRRDAPVLVEGPAAEAQAAADLLAGMGVKARAMPSRGTGPVQARWDDPD
ncbi:MAG TPA: TIGR00341 family protein [Erythrobacter sp.]|nr:TIGR00341 family protein [Erythrobacter sp.]